MSCYSSEDKPQFNLYELFITINAIPSIVALLGNILAVYVILGKKILRTSHNILVAGLAFTDLTTTIFSQIPMIVSSTYNMQTGYCILSAIISITAIGSLFSSVSILVLISYERYRCVLSDIIARSTTIRRSCLYLGISWSLGIIVALIFALLEETLVAMIFVPYMLGSVVFICFSYWKVSGKVKSTQRSLQSNHTGSNLNQSMSYEHSQMRYMRKILFILCSMSLSLSPLLLATGFQVITSADAATMYPYYTWAGSFFYFSGAINPFIYGLMNLRVGMEMKKIFYSAMSCCRGCFNRNPRQNRVDTSSQNVGFGE